MAYTKTVWVDGSAPAISAANLNNIEQGVYDSVRQDGTTAMSAQLVTIAGSATTPAIAPTGDSNNGIFFPAADTIAFGEGGAEAMRINSSGNVGIGTTSPAAKLDVRSSGEIARFCGTNTSNTYITFGNGTTQFGDIGYDARDTNAFSVFNATNGPLIFGTNVSEKMRITSAGNVGIGTTAPSAKLELSDGTITLQHDLVSGGGYIGTKSNHPLVLFTNNTEKVRITTAGYLLVGYTTSNGAYPLQVNGQIFATSSTIATSDQRYKKNITPLTGALNLVNALNPVQFDWKQHAVHNFNTEQPTVGFLAQEVAEVLKDQPYLNSVVKKSECTWETETGEFVDVVTQVEVDGELVDEVTQEAVKETHTEEFYGIAESNLIAILTKAVQELSAELQALKAQIAKK